jgi:hypothetical protein
MTFMQPYFDNYTFHLQYDQHGVRCSIYYLIQAID